MEKLAGKKDTQTCKCLINYGEVQYHFEEYDEAKLTYQSFLDMFEENKVEWEEQDGYKKLRDIAQTRIEEIDYEGEEGEGEEGDGDGYYDEEDGDDKADGDGDEEED